MILENISDQFVDKFDTEYWELKNNDTYWSNSFLSSLGYTQKDVTADVNFFLNNLIHKDYSKQFRNNYYSFISYNTDFRQSMLIKSKKGKYKEFVCSANNNLTNSLDTSSKFIFFNKRKFKTSKKINKDIFYIKETAEMTQSGSWYIDFIKKKTYWDQQARRILKYPEDYIPSVKKAKMYCAPDYFPVARKAFIDCAENGKSFDLEIKMIKTTQKEFWVRIVGKPVFNEHKNIIGLHGVFQDIDEKKVKELDLLRTSNIIASQNKRLFNFAHIVSHNLRSHSSNLTLITDLINASETIEEKLDLISSVESIANSLNETIEHLNEVVTIQTSTNKSKTHVCFDQILKQVTTSISQIITNENVEIQSDFSQLKCIMYIAAYLESIMLNLITNAIKYKHPERNPVIKIKSYTEGDREFLEITDNGLGIDLKKFGDKLFGMYKTFHYNKDAVGIGLFITKNQVQALHGEISVESNVNKGTTFRIKF